MKDFITDPATKFDFQPHEFVPFKDKAVCEYVRSLSGKDLEKREPWWHPEFEVKVMMNPHPVLIATLFERLRAASEAGKTFTMIHPKLRMPMENVHFPTNAYDGYFPMKDSYDEGGYEAKSSSFKGGVAETIIAEGTALLDDLRK